MEGFFQAGELDTRPPDGLVPKCHKCGLLKGCLTPKMPVAGKGKRNVLIIGEAPGETEDREGKPFIGKAGQRLQSEITAAGKSMFKDCWVTNALSCRPPNNTIKDEDEKIRACRPLVMSAIQKYNPVVIILAGHRAVKSVMSKLWRDDMGQAQQWYGWKIPCVRWNCWICPTLHPSFLERQHDDPVANGMFREHIRKAFKLKERPWPDERPDFDRQCEGIQDHEEAARAIRKMPKRYAWDLETTTLKPQGKDAEILCCSISDGERSIAFPWYGKAKDAMLERLADPSDEKVGWNVPFEQTWIQTLHGIRVRNWIHDGMTAAHGIDNRSNITGLKFQVLVNYGVEDYAHSIKSYIKGKGGHGRNRLKEVAMSELLHYCALDSLFEYKIGMRQYRRIHR